MTVILSLSWFTSWQYCISTDCILVSINRLLLSHHFHDEAAWVLTISSGLCWLCVISVKYGWIKWEKMTRVRRKGLGGKQQLWICNFDPQYGRFWLWSNVCLTHTTLARSGILWIFVEIKKYVAAFGIIFQLINGRRDSWYLPLFLNSLDIYCKYSNMATTEFNVSAPLLLAQMC